MIENVSHSTKDSQPYSIFALPRPVKVAFLFSPSESKYKIFDAILEYNLTIWGGRFNPIIPIIKKRIPQSYWNLLINSDPDIIYLYNEISEKTKLEILTQIQPLEIVYHYNQDNPHVSINIKQIPINKLVRRIKVSEIWDPYTKNQLMISNDFNNKKKILHNFLFRNLGIENDRLNERNFSKYFETEIIDEDSSMEEFFNKFTNKTNYIFPIQLGAIDVNSTMKPRQNTYKDFCIIIEESIWSYLYLWNRIFFHSENKIKQLCFPSNLFEKKSLVENLVVFLKRGLGIENGYQSKVEILYESALSNMQEENIKSIFFHFGFYPEFIKYNPKKIPALSLYEKNIQVLPETVHTKSDRLSTNLNLITPAYFENIIFDDSFWRENFNWMIDYKIEYRPEKFQYTNKQYWWLLKKVGDVSRLFFYSNVGRVKKSGLISVKAKSTQKNVEINIPSDETLFYTILTEKLEYVHNGKEKIKRAFYRYLEISDKGRYFLSTLNLFNSLLDAYHICASHFWRNFFEERCRTTYKNENKIQSIINSVRKHYELFTNSELNKEKGIEWIANKIIDVAHELKERKVYFTYSDLENKLKSLFKSESVKNNDRKIYFEDLLYSFNSLIDQKIIFQGVKPRCNACGSTYWYELQEISQSLNCKGCGNKFKIPHDIPWTFKINELVVNSIGDHGILPVIWFVYELYSRFDNVIFYPGVKLYKNLKGKNTVEVDIIALVNNRLAVCEIKNNVKKFTPNEIEKIKEVTINIGADIIILSALYGNSNKLKKIAEELQQSINFSKTEVISFLPHEIIFDKLYL